MKTMMMLAAGLVFLAAAGTGPAPAPELGSQELQFPHERHAALFTDCAMCHSGVRGQGAVYPDPSFCAGCHNGQVQPAVDYQPPTAGAYAADNFSHDTHPPLDCTACHLAAGAPAMAVERAAVDNCLSCHGIDAAHQSAPESPCSLCHAQAPQPASHIGAWVEEHAGPASSAPETCANCHVRSECLACHRPGAADPAPGYHQADYLSAHPAEAYSQLAECSSCHNPGQFCQDCHQTARLTVDNIQGTGYHDGQQGFNAGHGQAARQSLESCVACHTESSCISCHRGVNPHGPNFKAESLRKSNPQPCTVCHGTAIPGGSP
jgi:hypothetical protein